MVGDAIDPRHLAETVQSLFKRVARAEASSRGLDHLQVEYRNYLGIAQGQYPNDAILKTLERNRNYWRETDRKSWLLRQIGRLAERVSQLASPVAPIPPVKADESQQNTAKTGHIFLVHGRDDGAKETVARFIERLGLYPIILHEQASIGKTVIEKLEANSAVSFAVVILSPDDIGGMAGKPPKLDPRARQNVIFELGYFVGKLGRDKVCTLYKEGVQMPTDYEGVVYTLFDQSGAWRTSLARELREAGFAIDPSRIT